MRAYMDRRLSPRHFNNELELVSSRTMLVNGEDLHRGDTISADLDHGTRLRLWMSGRAIYKDDFRPTPTEADATAFDVTITETGGGWYVVRPTWLAEGEEGEKIKGKANAEARAAELLEEGPPETEDGGPDWSDYDADPAKWTAAQDEAFAKWFGGLPVGEDGKATEQADLPEGVAKAFADRRAAQEPDPWAGYADDPADWTEDQQTAFNAWYDGLEAVDADGKVIEHVMPNEAVAKAFTARRDADAAAAAELDSDGVKITEGENGWYEVAAEWAAEPEKVHGLDAAKERAAALRAEGPPPTE